MHVGRVCRPRFVPDRTEAIYRPLTAHHATSAGWRFVASQRRGTRLACVIGRSGKALRRTTGIGVHDRALGVLCLKFDYPQQDGNPVAVEARVLCR